jgi:hypothetical protein
VIGQFVFWLGKKTCELWCLLYCHGQHEAHVPNTQFNVWSLILFFFFLFIYCVELNIYFVVETRKVSLESWFNLWKCMFGFVIIQKNWFYIKDGFFYQIKKWLECRIFCVWLHLYIEINFSIIIIFRFKSYINCMEKKLILLKSSQIFQD